MDLKQQLTKMAKDAQDAWKSMQGVTSAEKNLILRQMADELIRSKDYILKANKKDLNKARAQKEPSAFIDRLSLNQQRIAAMAESLREVAKLKGAQGEVIKSWRTSSGLNIQKVRVPIGVVAIIYESRPNVTSDCIGLCFKSGNSVILRGGSESLNSNTAIFTVLRNVARKHKVAEGMINIVATADRKAVDLLLKLDNYIDLVIPRGGEGLIERVVKLSRIPVIKHYKGICHVYVDEFADLNMAEKICFNAKVQRPGVCNAMESMLVHRDVAARFLPGMLRKFKDAEVEIRGCPITRKIASSSSVLGKNSVSKATDKDYRSEYLDLILSVKVVDDLGAAVKHINEYGSHHTDAIVTEDHDNAEKFTRYVDSACVFVNASTRFTDGYQFGMGAEIGISTDKLHARGPMALEELTTYKYRVYGRGQIRE